MVEINRKGQPKSKLPRNTVTSRKDLLAAFEDQIDAEAAAWDRRTSASGHASGIAKQMKLQALRVGLRQYVCAHGAMPTGQFVAKNVPNRGGDMLIDLDNCAAAATHDDREPKCRSYMASEKTAHTSRTRKFDFVCRLAAHNEGVVIAPPDIAERNSRLRNAIEGSMTALVTWRELLASIPEDDAQDLWGRIARAAANNSEESPSLDDQASADAVPGFNDGDYPSWLQQNMDSWVPPEIMSTFAEHQSSILNGPFWYIEPGHLERIKRKLRAMGYRVADGSRLNFF
jgi:hypothetical protein